MADNTLYYGDNLDILGRYIRDESVDLIYLDPPFNSNANYNVLFHERDGSRSTAQFEAFEDTWEWGDKASFTFRRVVEAGGDVALALQAFRHLLGTTDMLAYLTMMAPRLTELRRVLKPTGSIYLHCDPTASHYLKILMDAIFGPENFRNEIIWRRTGAHGKVRRFGPIHDTILFYSNGANFKWNAPKRPYMVGHVAEYFVQDEKGWRTNYYGNVLTGSGLRNGESGLPWRGFDPSAKGRHWAIPGVLLDDLDEDLSGLSQHQKLDRLYELGFIKIVEGQAWPIYERYLKPEDGVPVPDIWAFQPYSNGTVFGTNDGIDEDVRWLSPRDQERLGYPTQKPVSLLQRIITASSNPGDVVLDPFCGCGTAVAAAQKLGRRWIGIDVTQLAVTLMKSRLQHTFGQGIGKQYDVIGEPTTLPEAFALAEENKFQFQVWALGLVGARPHEIKKGADQGIDGRLYFHYSDHDPNTKQVILSVKGGRNISVEDVRSLGHVVDREKAQMGVLITMYAPTGPMLNEAREAGVFRSPWGEHHKLQILTVAELLSGKRIDMPPIHQVNVTYRKAPKATADVGVAQRSLLDDVG